MTNNEKHKHLMKLRRQIAQAIKMAVEAGEISKDRVGNLAKTLTDEERVIIQKYYEIVKNS